MSTGRRRRQADEIQVTNLWARWWERMSYTLKYYDYNNNNNNNIAGSVGGDAGETKQPAVA